MTDNLVKNNKLIVAGKIISEPVFNHEVFGEKFYIINLEVNRLSTLSDVLPMMISDRLIEFSQLPVGQYIKIKGELRSFNKHEHKQNRLLLSLFVREIKLIEETEEIQPNYICIDGYICKPPLFRVTPRGREITDVLIAVNRSYNKSDYIPCICWGRNARYVGRLPIGSRVKMWGRIQSREYSKKIDENNTLHRVVYEVSVNKLEHKEEILFRHEKVAESSLYHNKTADIEDKEGK